MSTHYDGCSLLSFGRKVSFDHQLQVLMRLLPLHQTRASVKRTNSSSSGGGGGSGSGKQADECTKGTAIRDCVCQCLCCVYHEDNDLTCPLT